MHFWSTPEFLRQIPIRRNLDYLRILGGSKEAAKELKLFGLASFFTGRFTEFSHGIYRENVELAGRRLRVGALLTVLGTLGYYTAYAWVVWCCVPWSTIHRNFVLSCRGNFAGEQQHSADFLDSLKHRRPGSLSHRPAGLLRNAARHLLASRRIARTASDRPRL